MGRLPLGTMSEQYEPPTVPAEPDGEPAVADTRDLAAAQAMPAPAAEPAQAAEPAPAAPAAESTGDERVDQAISRLAELDATPVHEHAATVEEIHRALQDTLAEDES